jgi:L-threonylcarbamoyladenylate synthase
MPSDIERAVALLRAGELVGFPTETVYGLGADAANASAVAKIFAAKGRPADHPLILHLASAAHMNAWARDIPEAARRLAAAFWPGPLTLILKRSGKVLDAVTGGQDTVGLRVPGHPMALDLLRSFAGADDCADPGAVAAPSANRFGRISPTTADHVRSEFGAVVPLVLDGGPCAVGIESTIVDLSRGDPVILRPGGIGGERLAEVLGAAPRRREQAAAMPAPAPRVSGSLASHYAPSTPLRLVNAEALDDAVRSLLADDRRVVVLARHPPRLADHRLQWRQMPLPADAFARELYAELRRADAAGADAILCETPPASGDWQAVADRLGRAAAAGSDDIGP